MLSASAVLSVREAFNLHETDAGPTAASAVAAGDKTVVVVSRGQVRASSPHKSGPGASNSHRARLLRLH